MEVMKKITVRDIQALKGCQPITALTAYDTIMARLASDAGIDLLLVGDSVGTTYLGFDTTLSVTLDMMVHHTACVARARPHSLLVSDVPFFQGHLRSDRLLESCARLIQEGGAEAVKLEGGEAVAPNVQKLVEAGVPVVGHVGLLPQQVRVLGGYRTFGCTEEERCTLRKDAEALEASGAFAIVGEMIEAEVAGELARSLRIPFIGIGCGPHCDGQILVTPDLLGLTLGTTPSFVKRFADLKATVHRSFMAYAEAVRKRTYPLS